MSSKKCILLVRWLLLSSIVIHSLVSTVYIFYAKESAKGNFKVPFHPFDNLSSSQDGRKKRDIYFLKVHKTGSSTLQNMLYRFAMKEDLSIALFNRPAGMPYPDKPLAKYLYEDVSSEKFQPYNIMCDHAVFSKTDVNMYMNSNYVTIGLIREPLSHLRSAFKFWNIAKGFRLQSYSDPVKQFLMHNASEFSGRGIYQKFIQNMQAHHFGYISRSNNPEEINQFIQDIRSKFDLVLILEHFDKSLLLLRRLLNWDMHDVMYIKQFVNKQEGDQRVDNPEAVEAMQQAHRAIALADYRLYEFFNEDLQQRVQAAGADFQHELEFFHSLKAKLNKVCPRICDVLTNVPSPTAKPVFFSKTSLLHQIRRKLQESHMIYSTGLKWHKEVSLTLKDCVAMNLWSQHYHTAYRIHQLPQTCANHSLGSNSPISPGLSREWCDSSSYLFFKFPLKFVQQYLFGKLTTGPKSKTLSYC